MTAHNYIHFFHNNIKDNKALTKNILGGKGKGLMEMSALGINVPSGFIIDTGVCIDFYKSKQLPRNFNEQINQAITKLESITDKQLNAKNYLDSKGILLLSVRSGAPVSMPGMMDTILNIGITQNNISIIAQQFGERFAYNSYLRLLECFMSTVLNLDFKNLIFNNLFLYESFDKLLRSENRETALLTEFNDLIDFISEFITKKGYGEILVNAEKQLFLAIEAVIKSYHCMRAQAYRSMNNISNDMGTAVVVQSMVFGNLNQRSCTGVLFSRDPSTGENQIFGEYIINAQGEDVVSGICTPDLINSNDPHSMKTIFPECYAKLEVVTKQLELNAKDIQDIEFTVENNELFILQSRSAKRSAEAELKVAIDLVVEGVITKEEALLRINPESIDKLLHPIFTSNANVSALTRGLPASPGAAVGRVIFNSQKACEMAKNEKVLLVRMDTSPEDIMGMQAAQGILTARGGMTSHAAVVARGMGKPCVCGATKIQIYENKGYCEIIDAHGKKHTIQEGDTLSINGTNGEVFQGAIQLKDPEFSANFNLIMTWADQYRKLQIRVNADTEQDCKMACKFGVEGIGLCRTEHMFFDEKRILYVRQMILATNKEGRIQALEHIKNFQKEDFIKIFREMDGLPVTIRLLDPPLHEFLPLTPEAIKKFSEFSGLDLEYVEDKVNLLSEKNPMLGHRGCRLGISYPEIYSTQVEAIFEAALHLKQYENKIVVLPEIMIPIIAWEKECIILTEMIHETARNIFEKYQDSIKYLVGSMIELPRAALTADKISQHVDFLSFGTNDLTQTTLGLSRDDLINFAAQYMESGIFDKNSDPFVNLDPYVTELITIACTRARSVKPNIKIGICGEHGGAPNAIGIFHNLGFNYVSCSPFRLPVARLVAAQSAIINGSTNDKEIIKDEKTIEILSQIVRDEIIMREEVL